MTVDLTSLKDPSPICQIDPWSWVYYNKLKLFGGHYEVRGHEYQIGPLQCRARRQVAKKGTQLRWSEMLIIRCLHSLRYGRYPQGAMYILPTSDEVSLFSKSRFRSFLSGNPLTIGQYVRDTDAVDIKRIGDAYLHFRGSRLNQTIEGAQKTSSKLKSTPVDAVYFDELDEMDQDAIPLALARMQHSHICEEWYLANPTIPGFGIDRLYDNSDQRIWMIECRKCGRETSLDLEFPDCFKRVNVANGNINVIRVCKHCGGEIYPVDGYWIAQYPSRSKDLVGWWDSQLGSIYVTPKQLLDEHEDPKTDQMRFANLKLGKAYLKAENRLTHNDVYMCCGLDSMALSSMGPCAMGVDVGDALHVVIGERISDRRCRVVKICAVSTFNDVHDLVRKYNVRSAVFDMHPEIHKVREFAAYADYPVYGCIYSESQGGSAVWHESSKTVHVNRTEICDASHQALLTKGQIELPRRCEHVEIFAEHCCNLIKILTIDKKTGVSIYRYRHDSGRPDHYRHAFNYLMLALTKTGSVQRMPAGTSAIPGTAEPVDYYY